MIYESAALFLKRNHIPTDSDPDTFRDRAASLELDRSVLYASLQGLKNDRRELDMIKQNVDIIMNDTHEKRKDKKKERE